MLTLASIWKVAVEISQVGKEKVEITTLLAAIPALTVSLISSDTR